MSWIVPAAVVRVIDGDTVVVDADLGWHVELKHLIVRIAHINAPELRTAEGVEARGYALTLLSEGLAVTLESHSLDKYGRTLGSLSLPDGADFGKLMLDSGHAVPYL